MGQWPLWGARVTPTWKAVAPLTQSPVPEPHVPYNDPFVETHPAPPPSSPRGSCVCILSNGDNDFFAKHLPEDWP